MSADAPSVKIRTRARTRGARRSLRGNRPVPLRPQRVGHAFDSRPAAHAVRPAPRARVGHRRNAQPPSFRRRAGAGRLGCRPPITTKCSASLRGASGEDIKRAYRALAREHHPDVADDKSQAEHRFKRINEAYEVLSDPNKRAQYDRFGLRRQRCGRPRRRVRRGRFRRHLRHVLRQRARRRANAPAPAPNAARTCATIWRSRWKMRSRASSARYSFEHLATVRRLRGLGAQPGTMVVPCGTCGATGTVRSVRQTPLGQMMTQTVCGRCAGERTRRNASVPSLRRPRPPPGRRASHDRGAARRGRRIAHPDRRQRRSGLARRASGRSVRVLARRAPPAVQARRPRYVRGRAGQIYRGGAGCDARCALARRRSRHDAPARHAVATTLKLRGHGMPGVRGGLAATTT